MNALISRDCFTNVPVFTIFTNYYENMSEQIAKPAKVAIIGAGAVGSTLAYACITRGVGREIVLYDIDKTKAEAEALDIAQGQTFAHHSKVYGGDDPAVCANADVVIITAGAKQKPGQSRLDIAGATINIMEKMLPKVLEQAPNAVYIMVSNPVDVVTYAALKITGLPRERMFGSGTVIDTSRFRLLVAQEIEVAPRSIHGYIVGEHGDSEIALWSSVNIGCVSAIEWGGLSAAVQRRIAHEVVDSAYKIIDGKGATNYAIGLSGVRIVEAVLNDERTIMPISSLINNVAGIHDICLSIPTVVNRGGAGRIVMPDMTETELQGIKQSANRVKAVAAKFGY